MHSVSTEAVSKVLLTNDREGVIINECQESTTQGLVVLVSVVSFCRENDREGLSDHAASVVRRCCPAYTTLYVVTLCTIHRGLRSIPIITSDSDSFRCAGSIGNVAYESVSVATAEQRLSLPHTVTKAVLGNTCVQRDKLSAFSPIHRCSA